MMKPDQKHNPVLAGLAVLFTIGFLMIAGCTDALESHQGLAVTTPETQAGHVTQTISTTRTIPLQVTQPSLAIVPKNTSDPSERAIPSGILIDSIPDIRAGDPLVVSGRTSLPVGANLNVIVVPATMESGKITGDFKNLELSTETRVNGGTTNGNRFSVALDTANLPLSDHIVFVSEKSNDASGITSATAGGNCSLLFNIIGR